MVRDVMNGKTVVKHIIAIIGFLALGLSPSYIDWKEEPEMRRSMVWYYLITLALIWFGIFSTNGEL